jgi:hypothetical protein
MTVTQNKPILLAISAIIFFLSLFILSGTGFIVPNEEVLILFCFIGFVRLAYLNVSDYVVAEFNVYSDSVYFANEVAFNKVKGSLVVLTQCFDLLESLLSEINVLAINIQLYIEYVLERKVLVDLFFKVEDSLLLILRQSAEISKNHQHAVLLSLANEIC